MLSQGSTSMILAPAEEDVCLPSNLVPFPGDISESTGDNFIILHGTVTKCDPVSTKLEFVSKAISNKTNGS